MNVTDDKGHIYVKITYFMPRANEGAFLAIRVHRRSKEIAFTEEFFSPGAFSA